MAPHWSTVSSDSNRSRANAALSERSTYDVIDDPRRQWLAQPPHYARSTRLETILRVISGLRAVCREIQSARFLIMRIINVLLSAAVTCCEYLRIACAATETDRPTAKQRLHHC